MPPTEIELARYTLWMLWADTEGEQVIEEKQRAAILIVLDELHRMNQVANDQRAAITKLMRERAARKGKRK